MTAFVIDKNSISKFLTQSHIGKNSFRSDKIIMYRECRIVAIVGNPHHLPLPSVCLIGLADFLIEFILLHAILPRDEILLDSKANLPADIIGDVAGWIT